MLNRKNITENQLHQLSQQLAILLKAGITLIKALQILINNNTKASVKNLLQNIQTDIEQGLSFHQALSKFPQYFSNYYCCLVQCGEKTGCLVQSLEKIANYQAIKFRFKQKCRHALAYPCFVLLSSLTISLGILMWIIPLFAHLFADNQHSLPKLTQLVFNFSKHLSTYSLITFLSLAISLYLLKLIMHLYFPLKFSLAKLSTRCLGLRYLIQLIQLNRWLPLISHYLQAGMHLFTALEATGDVFNHVYYANCYTQLLHDMQAGAKLTSTMRNFTIFPESLIHLIAVGEESGNMTALFTEATTIYQQKLETLLLKLTQLIEPLSLLLVSLLIGMLVIALYLPLFNIGEVL